MNNPALEIQILAALVAVTCTLSGVFLVLRKMAMMSDAISHSILLGIAIAFLYTNSIHSPLLILGAAATGLITVFLVELLKQTNLVAEDAAIGLIFTALFSIGVIIISRYAANVHLDIDAVLLGEIAFAPFRRLTVFGYDLGPKSIYIMAGILLLNLLFISLFFKELKLITFDPKLAAALGFTPALIHYSLMGVVSITAVGAFDAVGSILVVALMVVPPLTAYLLTEELENMLLISGGFGVAIGILGYQMARILDVSIAGSMASMAGLLFLLTFLLAPKKGLISIIIRRKQQQFSFACLTLLIHLFNHEDSIEINEESNEEHIIDFMRWPPPNTLKIINQLIEMGLITNDKHILRLTDQGRYEARIGLNTIKPSTEN